MNSSRLLAMVKVVALALELGMAGLSVECVVVAWVAVSAVFHLFLFEFQVAVAATSIFDR